MLHFDRKLVCALDIIYGWQLDDGGMRVEGWLCFNVATWAHFLTDGLLS